MVKQKGKASSFMEKYQASKTLAERKAWEMYQEGKAKGTIGWDLVTLCPPFVFGPYLGEVTLGELNYSIGMWYRVVVQETLPLPPPFDAYVDVNSILCELLHWADRARFIDPGWTCAMSRQRRAWHSRSLRLAARGSLYPLGPLPGENGVSWLTP